MNKRKGKQRQDEPTGSRPVTPIENMSRPRTRSQKEPPKQDKASQGAQQCGLQQQDSRRQTPGTSHGHDANSPRNTEGAQWMYATGNDMRMIYDGDYACNRPEPSKATPRPNVSRWSQTGQPMGSKADVRPASCTLSAFEGSIVGASGQAPADWEAQREANTMAQHLLQQRLQQSMPTSLPFQPSFLGSPYGYLGGLTDAASNANLQDLVSAAKSFDATKRFADNNIGPKQALHGHLGGRGSGLGFGSDYSGPPSQYTPGQQRRPGNFMSPRGALQTEFQLVDGVMNLNSLPTILNSQGPVIRGSPLPAPHPLTAIPPNFLRDQPVLLSQQDQSKQENSGGLLGYTGAQTQLLPMDLANPRLRTSADARTYLNHVFWRPFTKDHGVPRTEQERMPYVKIIYDAIVALDTVLDLTPDNLDAKRFWACSGMWGTVPIFIEAIAHQVVDTCIDLHVRGITGFALGRQMKELCRADRTFTFAQRIHFMGTLLRCFKLCANLVMTSVMTKEYLARIWSTLQERLEFKKAWDRLPHAAQQYQIEVQPYVEVPANQPTPAEFQELMRQYQQEQEQCQAEMRQRHMQSPQYFQPSAPPQPPQTPAQSALKRPVDAVENAQVGPPTKRRSEVSFANPAALPEQIQNSQIQEESAEGGGFGTQPPPINNMQQAWFEASMSREAYEDLSAAGAADNEQNGNDLDHFDDIFGPDSSVWDNDHGLFGDQDAAGEEVVGKHGE